MQCMEVWGGNGISDNGVTMPGLDAWVLARPAEGSSEGGDIHYVSSCGTGRISRLMVADVSGHGTVVAETAGKLRSLLRRYVNYVDQTQFFSKINMEFAQLAKVGMFATAIVVTYWSPTDALAFSNAGHPRPLVYAAKRREWFVLKQERASRATGAANLPLGVIDESTYEQLAVRAQPGDLVVIYTDSLTEAKRRDGSMLGETGLVEVMRGLDVSKPQELARAIYEGVIAACGGATPEDDVTIMVLRPNGVKPPQTFRQKVDAIVKFGRMLVGAGEGGPVPWPEVSLANLAGPFVPALNRRWLRGAKGLGG